MGIKRKRKKNKIFCIGLNKTGTTSLGTFLENVNLSVAKQNTGELLLKSYLKRDFFSIIDYCEKSKASVFQDVPFSLPYTFYHLDNAFPESKFILTIRDSDEQWYQSILKFHSNVFNNGEKPTQESLINSLYIYKGWAWDLMSDVYISSSDNMYNEEEFKKVYNNHITNVKDYFKNKSDRLIIINLAVDEDFKKLCRFLNIETDMTEFPRITSNDIAKQNFTSRFLKK